MSDSDIIYAILRETMYGGVKVISCFASKNMAEEFLSKIKVEDDHARNIGSTYRIDEVKYYS